MLINYETNLQHGTPTYNTNTLPLWTRQILMDASIYDWLRFMGGVLRPMPIEPSWDPA